MSDDYPIEFIAGRDAWRDRCGRAAARRTDADWFEALACKSLNFIPILLDAEKQRLTYWISLLRK
jgi:hypothetical protein